jgi:Na+-transporting NADH:ubiquinone oxidoreductase subunit NqrC
MKEKIAKVFITAVLISSICSIAFATTNYGLSEDLNKAVDRIKAILQTLGFLAAAFCAIFGGFQIITAGGSVEKVETGRRWIMYALVGLAVVLLGWGIAGIACYIGTGSWTCPTATTTTP